MLNSCFGTRVGSKLLCAVLSTVVMGCESSVDFAYTDLRVYQSPYADVDWSNDLRLKAQHHDHMAGRPDVIVAYDAAGYDVLSLMDYSGNPKLRFALDFRLWPPERWVPNWALSGLQHVKLFIPNAEEVGLGRMHITSPFLERYIEVTDVPPPPPPPTPTDYPDIATLNAAPTDTLQYTSRQEMFELIERGGGVPCFAHSWDYGYDNVRGNFCAEIYNAYGSAMRSWGDKAFTEWDRNLELVQNWDYALQGNQQIFGIAVNDHFGPDSVRVSPQIRDSGKIVVFAREATRVEYEKSFRRGAFFAIKDLGENKDEFPEILSIDVGESGIFIETLGHVRWISKGMVIGENPFLLYRLLPVGARYLRAEVSNDAGSVVYTQAFAVRPIGDVDGDYDVDSQDRDRCAASSAASTPKVIAAACAAAKR